MHKILRSKRPHCKILLKCCNYKKVYPRLTPSVGEELNSRIANITNETKPDTQARGFWERGR